MSIRITTLIENSAGEDPSLSNEHGISFFIEKDGRSLLFDTGQSSAFIRNSNKMGIDLSSTDFVVLSHGHYDHTGGFTALSKISNNFELLVKEGIFTEKYSYKDGSYSFKGNSFDRAFLDSRRIAYRFIEEECTGVLPGAYLVGNFPRIFPDEVPGEHFVVLENGQYRHDTFDDEVLLALDSPKGLVLVLGCSHPGVRNMIEHAKKLLKRPVYAILGGTHLKEAEEKRREDTIDYLVREVEGPIGVSHCTGEKAMARLSAATPRYFHNITGSVLEV
ncbi:MAG: MBL fold metallo-hydrolase [Spirochaetaceae bacterium]